MIRPRHLTDWARGTGLLIALLLVAGCASRGFVRTEVGESEETLSTRIEEVDTGLQGEISDTRTQVAELDARTGEQGNRLDAAENVIENTRQDLNQVRDRADEALETAQSANERVDSLSSVFDERNRYEVEATHEFFFEFDSSQLRTADSSDLASVTSVIEDNPNAIVLLEGHTDSLGEDNYNVTLAEKRVEAVKRYLVVDAGIPVYRIHSFSFGEAQPPYPGEDRENRSRNRVVTLSVLVPAGSGDTVAAAAQD